MKSASLIIVISFCSQALLAYDNFAMQLAAAGLSYSLCGLYNEKLALAVEIKNKRLYRQVCGLAVAGNNSFGEIPANLDPRNSFFTDLGHREGNNFYNDHYKNHTDARQKEDKDIIRFHKYSSGFFLCCNAGFALMDSFLDIPMRQTAGNFFSGLAVGGLVSVIMTYIISCPLIRVPIVEQFNKQEIEKIINLEEAFDTKLLNRSLCVQTAVSLSALAVGCYTLSRYRAQYPL